VATRPDQSLWKVRSSPAAHATADARIATSEPMMRKPAKKSGGFTPLPDPMILWAMPRGEAHPSQDEQRQPGRCQGLMTPYAGWCTGVLRTRRQIRDGRATI